MVVADGLAPIFDASSSTKSFFGGSCRTSTFEFCKSWSDISFSDDDSKSRSFFSSFCVEGPPIFDDNSPTKDVFVGANLSTFCCDVPSKRSTSSLSSSSDVELKSRLSSLEGFDLECFFASSFALKMKISSWPNIY